MSEPDKTNPTAQHRKFQVVGLLVIAFGTVAALNLGRTTISLLQGAGPELRNQGPLVTFGVLAQIVAFSIIVAGYQLITRGDRFSWGNVLGFWTKTAVGQLLLAAGLLTIGVLMWMTSTVQDSWPPRVGYWLALWLVCSLAVVFLRRVLRQLRSRRTPGENNTGPGSPTSEQD
ncbi:hypothetical protein DE4585_02652 [Mycobacteroides salmoniphilum]|uniref:Uncharacterized protein n=1 Tax=Mycobacteroides salmoniphilum TaxID=404941 RepID=A0A4R8S159_9MYCO|nr:hypothetical protein [Mycobacteroides salmoniphilum]TDZ82123.1 hypothetical protein DE4585_02652 [Mycobacteroides salmoniphilum]